MSELKLPGHLRKFRIACCRFTLEADQAISLPDLPGVPLSKSAGQHFRKLFCIQPGVACETCILHPCCLYTRLYESVRHVGRGERFFPPPFVVRAVGPAKVLPGDRYVFDLLLFGNAVEGLPAWVVTMGEAGQMGLRDPRCMDESAQTFHVVSVDECLPDGTAVRRYEGALRAMTSSARGPTLDEWQTHSPYSPSIELSLLTPLQITSRDTARGKPDVFAIVTSGMRRLESLVGAAGDDGWLAFADRVWDETRASRLEKTETEHVQARISHRSKSSWKHVGHSRESTPFVRYHGHVGRLAVSHVGPHLAWLLQTLSLIHVGRKTSVGMGWICMEPLE